MKKQIIITILSTFMVLMTGTAAFAADLPGHTGEYVSIRENLKNGKQLIMCGLAADRKADFIAEFEQKYRAGKSCKYTDPSFIDAEKYNKDFPEEATADDDNGFCWACSISNMLWMSGWAEDLSNPLNGRKFSSEDDIFTYYYSRFVNGGSDTFPGVEFFFDGHYFKSHGNGKAGLCEPDNRAMFGSQIESDGLRKDIAASEICIPYDLTQNLSDMNQLEKICSTDGSNSVFQASVGVLGGGISLHSVNVTGVLIDPDESNAAKRYVGLLIADADNDATPSEAMAGIEHPTDEQREADKISRDNSYTFYPLRCVRDSSGNDCWELVGYLEDDRTQVFGITELKCRTDEVASQAIETEGSRNSLKDVDLSTGRLFTTSASEPVDLEDHHVSAPIKTSFGAGTPVRLNFELQNRSEVDLDESVTDGKTVTVKYDVSSVNEDTSTSLKTGTFSHELPLEGTGRRACLISLNDTDGKTDIWPVGRYEVSLEVNPASDGKRLVTESYCRNNVSETRTFTITPPAKAIKTVKSGRKKLTVKWSRSSEAMLAETTGYQIRYSSSKAFTSYKTKTASKNDVSRTLTSLKADRKYYIKMRTYKVVDGQTYYSAWSKVTARRTR